MAKLDRAILLVQHGLLELQLANAPMQVDGKNIWRLIPGAPIELLLFVRVLCSGVFSSKPHLKLPHHAWV